MSERILDEEEAELLESWPDSITAAASWHFRREEELKEVGSKEAKQKHNERGHKLLKYAGKLTQWLANPKSTKPHFESD